MNKGQFGPRLGQASELCPVVLLRCGDMRRVDIEFRSRHPAGHPPCCISVVPLAGKKTNGAHSHLAQALAALILVSSSDEFSCAW